MQSFVVTGRPSAFCLRSARPATRAVAALPRAQHRRPVTRVLAQDDRDTDTDLTGEWPVNWSLASYEDVGEFFQNNLFKESAQPGKTLSAVMAKDVRSVTPDTKLETLRSLFDRISGVPVVRSDSDKTLVGVLSRKDMQGASASATVKEVMSTPPIAAKPDNKVADAAVLMLKHKVHRIPVVDAQAKLVGIVTRTDIFTALATETGM